MQQEFITVTFNRTKIAIRCADILYVIMSDDHCRIHMFDGNVYRCRMTLKELKKQLNEEFIEVKRGCMVAVSAISDIGDRILLSNGEKICYTKRKKRVLREELQKNHSGIPHGGFVLRSGKTGWNGENSHLIEYSLKLDSNPEFTSSVIVAYARAAYRMNQEGQKGCKTVFDVAPAYLSALDGAELRKKFL